MRPPTWKLWGDQGGKEYFLIFLLGVYFQIFQVFKLFLDEKLKVYDQVWESRIQRLGEELKRRHTRYDRLYREDGGR